METQLLLLYIIIIGLYNIGLNLTRRKGKQVANGFIILQVVLNLILVAWGLAYLFLG